MIRYIVAAALFMVLFIIFTISLLLNKRTPFPKGFELPSIQCQHCKSTTCNFSEANRPNVKSNEVTTIECEKGSEE